MSAPTYSHADVLRLVMEVTHTLRSSPRAVFNQDGIAEALKPFQPDPEAELIEAMADAIGKVSLGTVCDVTWKNEARAALAVLKERDLLKTPRKEATL